MNTKTCTKCKNTFAATLEFFYRNSSGKYGVTPRCKPCVNEDNAVSEKKRREANPERVKELGNARARKYYERNKEKCRKSSRESAARRRQDPIKKEIIQARKRAGGAGLSPEEIKAIRDSQENKCAICGSFNPTDLDHCHSSGKIRWLLCGHCNRGLGAFMDSPLLLRKAANILESL